MTHFRTEKKSPLAPLGDIDRRTVKTSARRLVLSGDSFELYEYERPYFFNRPPEKRGAKMLREAPENAPRREDNLVKARARIRRLIAANVNAYAQKPKFITFTFAKNVTELKEAHLMWAEFTRKMREEFGPLKYLAVVEFQKRGAIHYHVLYFNLPFRYGIKTLLQKTWGHGWVKLITVKHVKNLGAYVSKYLQKDIMDCRLWGEKAFFCSKGLRQPEQYRDEREIAKMEASCMLTTEMVKVYDTAHFGRLTYRQGIYKKIYP